MTTITEIPPRILREAKLQADRIANSIANRYSINKIKSWADIAAQYSLDIPEDFKSLPWSYDNVANIRNPNSFVCYWTMSTELRLRMSMSTAEHKSAELKPNTWVETYGKFTLKPDQQSVMDYMYNFIIKENHPAIFDMSYAGSGKGVTAACFIAKLYKEKILDRPEYADRLYKVIVFCPRNMAEQWRRELEKAGLAAQVASQEILVFPFTDFSAGHSTVFCDEHEDFATGEVAMKWNKIFQPAFAFIDEYHNFCNARTRRTRAILSLAETLQPKHFICLSATPAEKINDLYLFTLLSKPTFQGVRIKSPTEFGYMARCLDARPDKPNAEALKRYRKAMEPYMVSVPYVKPPFVATNRVLIVDFENREAREVYDSAVERYKEACAKSGRNTTWGRFQMAVELGILNRTVEPLRAYEIAARTAKNYHSGKIATAVGTAYLETISNIGYRLVKDFNIPRERISVIWGGKDAFKPKDLLTSEQLKEILAGDMTKINALFDSDPRLAKKVLTTLKYLHDQAEHQETASEQAARHAALKDLNLVGMQSLKNRQLEIDKFQSGETTVNLFTVYCGREGLSFDRSKPELLPREGLFTPIYNGKQYKQLLNRLVRRESLSGADQYTCMMRGTTEEWHIAPKLDLKLKCISSITNRFIDAIDLMLREDKPIEEVKLRTEEEALKDAKEDDYIPPTTLEEEEPEEWEELELEDALA